MFFSFLRRRILRIRQLFHLADPELLVVYWITTLTHMPDHVLELIPLRISLRSYNVSDTVLRMAIIYIGPLKT